MPTLDRDKINSARAVPIDQGPRPSAHRERHLVGSERSQPDHLRNFPKKNFVPKKIRPFAAADVRPRVLGNAEHAEMPRVCPADTPLPRCAAGVAGNSGAFAPAPRISSKNRKRSDAESIGPSAAT